MQAEITNSTVAALGSADIPFWRIAVSNLRYERQPERGEVEWSLDVLRRCRL